MSEMKGNPHFSDHLLGFPDERSVPAMVAALTYEQRTANLIAAHQASNLIVNDADRLEIEREILHRLGVRGDA